MVFSPLEQFDAIYLFGYVSREYDFAFFSTVVPLALIAFFLELFLFFFDLDFAVVPEFWQYLCEILFKFVVDIVVQQAGKGALVYFPFVFNLFVFVLFCNLLSLVPFGLALTSHISVIFFLSFSLWLSVFFLGLQLHNLAFLRLFVPQAPFFVLLLLIPIEMASYAIRALSLSIRLSANIMAGHILVYIVSSFVFYMSLMHCIFALLIGLLLMILLLELGVAFVQAYVFTVLFCIYLNDSLKVPGH